MKLTKRDIQIIELCTGITAKSDPQLFKNATTVVENNLEPHAGFQEAISLILAHAVQAAADHNFSTARLLFRAAGNLKDDAFSADDRDVDEIEQEFEAAAHHMPEEEW